MQRIIILCGIPTSGKSTWTQKFLKAFQGSETVSRDDIRYRLFGKNYYKKQRTQYKRPCTLAIDEKFVTTVFERTVRTLLEQNIPYIVLDNTHCKESYLKQAIEKYEKEGYEIWLKFFDIPLRLAYYRNIIRWIKTGKYIPIKILKDMNRNYLKINKEKYNEKYIFC